jgi:chromosome segregation ATPase
MVEPLVYGGLGFLIACLGFLVIARLLWRRAVRLTTRRLIDRLPMSRTDIVAEHDFVRAEAAVQMRVMERRAGRLQAEIAEARIELGRREATLSRLKGEMAATQTGAATAEMLRAESHELRAEKAAALAAQAAAEAARDEAAIRLKRAEADLAEANVNLDALRVEIAALRTDLANAETIAAREARSAGVQDGAARERALQERVETLETELAAHREAGSEAAADRALLRGRIEQLAAEIARLSGVEVPQAPRARQDTGPQPVQVANGRG